MSTLWRTPLETVWNADRFDQAEWLSAIDSIPQLSTADQQADRDLCGHPVQDGFFGLFKANPQLAEEPAPSLLPLAELMKRGGAYYSTVATQLLTAHYNDLGETHVVNIRNNGAVKEWDPDWVLEIPSTVKRSGVTPIPTEPPNRYPNLTPRTTL